ncbi:MAG: helix-turn-helix transcriptional regulator [Salinisphaera sp.]|jgi:transcriptional regulator with XRE-family HTH domain|nr:helix-turn-helix transcriptional regulator [Salinisphaera sp.]
MSAQSSRNFLDVLLRAARGKTQVEIAQASGIDKTKLSRVFSGEVDQLKISEIGPLLAALELQIIQCEGTPVFMSAAKYHATTYYAGIGQRHEQAEADRLLKAQMLGDE